MRSEGATAVVIVNYRTKELSARAAGSVLAEPEVREVVVVDNGSGDGSIEFLRQALPAPPCRVIGSPSNLGFGRAANLAAEQTSAPFLFFLNSDATVVPGALAPLVEAMLADESTGAVAPAVFEADGTTLQPGAFGRFPQVLEPPWPRSSRVCAGRDGELSPDWISAVAMLVRRRDFLDAGGFDPAFEMYLEDVDLCRRLRDSGRTVQRRPEAAVVHLGGRSWVSSVEQRASYQSSKLTYFRKRGASPTQMACIRALGSVRVLAARIAGVGCVRRARSGRAGGRG